MLLTSCATDWRSAQAVAVRDLSRKGFDVSGVGLAPRIVIEDNIKAVSESYFLLTGIYTTVPGFYVSTDRTVYFYKYCSINIAAHEFEHDLLFQLGVPLSEHHGIINVQN